MSDARPITILIAALGGEGGGVLADWIIDAALQGDLPAQATSIPGVAQRTGATTYYLEVFPVQRERLDGREPVMSLTPNPGNVDIMVASELIEAGRAMQNGYVSPERTTLVASTHRIYATVEKMQMGDGRFDSSRVLDAARRLAKQPVLFDMRAVAHAHGTVINAVLFGAMAGSGALPMPRAACEQAIRHSGKGADASLRGFDAGFRLASGESATEAPAPKPRLPPETRQIIDLGVARLKDYQGDAYAALYLERLRSFGDAEPKLLGEVARHLAVWMSYEDVIRVADLKSRASRFERVRREAGAKSGEPVVIIDYLKPGADEFASLLPPALGAAFLAWAERTGRLHALNLGMHVKTSSAFGYLTVRALAWLKPWRPHSYRYALEQQLIERWLGHISAAAKRDAQLALEITECARLVKGYSDTHRRGVANFLAILDALVENPASDDPREQARSVAKAREAALADPDGNALSAGLGRPVNASKPVIWLSKSP